jgi:hyperosmotically inducible protein
MHMHMQFRKLMLASGIALAIGATSAAYAGDTVSQDVTDARQETQIWTTYALSPYLRAHDLKVSVHGGKATLSGTVEEDVNRDLAKQIALGVKGITDVDNQIVVKADYIPPKSSADRSFGEVVDDATITAAVKSKLLWSKNTDGMEIDVDTRAQRVTLKGKAASAESRDLAGRLATNTRGVHAVDNRLTVDASTRSMSAKTEDAAKAAGTEVTDGWITTKVKSTFLYSTNIDGTDISVETEHGIVTLKGNVDSGAERALAIELAQNVRGVKSVDSKGLAN